MIDYLFLGHCGNAIADASQEADVKRAGGSASTTLRSLVAHGVKIFCFSYTLVSITLHFHFPNALYTGGASLKASMILKAL